MFFYLLILFFILILLLLFSKIKIDISNVKISTEKQYGKFIDKDYKLTVLLFVLGKIPIIKVNITKEKLENLKVKEKIEIILRKRINNLDIEKLKSDININKETLKKVNKSKPEIEHISLIANIGTESAILTSYVVAVISGMIGVLLRKTIVKSNNNKFIITPVYVNKNLINLELDCIFTIKMIYIIFIIYILIKKKKKAKKISSLNKESYSYIYKSSV